MGRQVRRDSQRDDPHIDTDLGPLPPDLDRVLSDLERQFVVDVAELKNISLHFEHELHQGLARVSRCLLPSCVAPLFVRCHELCHATGLEPEDDNIPMNVTWVFGWPTGHESGEYLTIDLGGTKLRVCWVILKEGKGETRVTQNIYQIPEEFKTGEAEPFWDFIADSIADFIKEHGLKGTKEEPLPLGFTFSYPATQEYIDHGVLQTWTKGFDVKGIEGHDVVQALHDSLDKKQIPVRTVALINDTTGAMIASAYSDPDTVIGAIFGTGCNAAYMEKCGGIPKIGGFDTNQSIAINCEYGAFDNELLVLPRTKYDDAIDAESPRPGEQAFEKMSAGLYLGEIFRKVMVDVQQHGLIFDDQNTSRLEEAYSIDTGFLSSLENDDSDGMADTRDLFKQHLGIDVLDHELLFLRRLAEAIAVRGARLCTTGVAAICRKRNITRGHVAADGSVAIKHPKFRQRWAKAMAEVLDWPADRKEDPIVITPAEDGSGIGAAVISAMIVQRKRDGDFRGMREGDPRHA